MNKSFQFSWPLITSLFSCIVLLNLSSCESGTNDIDRKRFEEVPEDYSGITFANQLDLDSSMNVFLYRNYYNGGGVAIGDVDADGLEDIYLTANRLPNRLYRNLGNLKFEDITDVAGVAGSAPWSTGVAMADVNADGFLDIYVCNSGDVGGNSKANELFINNGDGTFTEAAEQYGLNDQGFTTHATFFDYDHDGDLDCYILNNSFQPIATLGLRNLRNRRDTLGGDKLYRNDDGYFSDVSESAGIFGSVIGFGLGVSVSDVTGDGWEDIYVSNDFYERDYLYVNNKNGTFSEELPQRIQTISHFSMGADINDLNNDGRPEIFVTDMLPRNDARLKRTTKFAGTNDYNRRLESGFHHQAMRNTLQWNLGEGTFAEVGQMHGLAATDWSWGALMADFDNNGFRDIIVCNGAYKDVTNQDFINYMSSDETVKAARKGAEINFQTFVNQLPSVPTNNAAFENIDGKSFRSVTSEWGFEKPTFSNGAAYADMDQDGDLDLIVNNLNSPIQLFRNTSVEQGDKPAFALSFLGSGLNTQAIGATADFYYDDAILSYQHFPVKGFQSSMTYKPLISLPADAQLDSVIFRDVYGREIRLDRLANEERFLEIDFSKAGIKPKKERAYGREALPWTFVTSQILLDPVLHTEDTYNEYDRDRLLYLSNASDGPAFAIGNSKSTENAFMYLGGSAAAPGQLLKWNQDKKRYVKSIPFAFAQDKAFEDCAALFIDFDNDGDDDLIVGSSGSEFFGNPRAYQLRAYEQRIGRNGEPTFVSAPRFVLPQFPRPVNALVKGDFNEDGILDFAAAGRLHPNGYGMPAPIAVYLGNGRGFTLPKPDPTQRYPDGGLISDMTLADINGDGKKELVAVGEFMPVTIYFSTKLPFDSIETIPNTRGMFYAVLAADVDLDGKEELLCGGLGNNTFLSGPDRGSLHLYVGDIDGNGQVEHIYAQQEGDQLIPLALKHELEQPIPSIKKAFVKYEDYADKTLTEVFEQRQLEQMKHYQADRFESIRCTWSSTGWKVDALPVETQVSIVKTIVAVDADEDGDLDIILGGNLYGNQPRMGPLDASRGTLLLNEQGSLSVEKNGGALGIYGQLRHLIPFVDPTGYARIAIAKNQGQLEVASFKHGEQ